MQLSYPSLIHAAFRLNTRSGDEVEARLTPALRERLLQLEKPYLEVEGFGDRLAVSRRCWVGPAKAGAALDQAMEILEHLLKSGDPARR